MPMEDAIARIRKRYAEQLREHGARLRPLLDQLVSGRATQDILEEVQFRAHKIHGTAATLGFAELGTRAAECEHETQAQLAAGNVAPAALARVAARLELLIREIERAERAS
ncbi:Hpt domain-containing protein [Meinhardsimonia xiamenensis]|jgi:HPt (histidine-containing phosphotransfer) domain-containing protein|uniref:Hpt domain-containing protein n=1 Tax=Meinhardsimonia xiamenensis TaxID=990712 RepID=A0A1G9ECT4_9RHOB|nr:Hpt domain-containing protein [Meinhardsimonia xiamenensis]PRX33829.1 Hpt domain-containing protein [Meinhardsimonia xiamenensis]SDK73893.1 Hpt domain-containing protein [Meinhardsimonia xiamenensis]